MQVDRAEFLRYLGWRGQETDELVLAKLDDAAKRCLDAASPRMVARRFALGKNLELAGTGFILEGQDIRAHLAGCSEVYLFAATLGIAAERELAKLSARGAYEALLFDTACSCAIESYCDDICDDLQKSCGKRLLPRFSCGYGDFPLEAQRDICRLLRTDTAIGLCCDESCLLTPRKSVTAVVGITDEAPSPTAKRTCGSCAACRHTGCAFRRKDQ